MPILPSFTNFRVAQSGLLAKKGLKNCGAMCHPDLSALMFGGWGSQGARIRNLVMNSSATSSEALPRSAVSPTASGPGPQFPYLATRQWRAASALGSGASEAAG